MKRNYGGLIFKQRTLAINHTDFYYSFFQGIRNILALGGDHSYVIKPEDEATFKDDPKLRYASDLVRQIRNEWGSEFTVCVAGYPQVVYERT